MQETVTGIELMIPFIRKKPSPYLSGQMDGLRGPQTESNQRTPAPRPLPLRVITRMTSQYLYVWSGGQLSLHMACNGIDVSDCVDRT